MKRYLGALGTIWGVWCVVFLVSTALSDDALDNTATLVAYLSWFVGIPVAVVSSLVACGAIAYQRRSAVRARRQTTRPGGDAEDAPVRGPGRPSSC